MIIPALMNLVKSPKVIIGIVAAGILASGAFYVYNLKGERDSFMLEVNRMEGEISELVAENKGLEHQAEVQEQTIEQYLRNQRASEQRQEQLAWALSQTSEELQQCLDKPLPPEILDEIFQ